MEATFSRKKPDKRTRGLSDLQLKERRTQQMREYNKRRVYMGEDLHRRWKSTRDRLGLKSDQELFKVLLGRFEIHDPPTFETSAPIRPQAPLMVSHTSSDVDAEEWCVEQVPSQDMSSTSGGKDKTNVVPMELQYLGIFASTRYSISEEPGGTVVWWHPGGRRDLTV